MLIKLHMQGQRKGVAGLAIAPPPPFPVFGRSVNTIPTRGQITPLLHTTPAPPTPPILFYDAEPLNMWFKYDKRNQSTIPNS